MSELENLEVTFKRQLRLRLLHERIIWKKPPSGGFLVASDQIDAEFLIGESLKSDFLSALWVQASQTFNLTAIMRLHREDLGIEKGLLLNPNTQWLRNTLQDLHDAGVDGHLLIQWVEEVLREMESKKRH